jgi:hypothetical protein
MCMAGRWLWGDRKGEPARRAPGWLLRLLKSGSTEVASGADHVDEGGLDLFPAAGFEAAVGVHPKIATGQHGLCFAHEAFHLLRGGNPGRMDVIHAGSDLIGILETDEGLEQFHVGA